MQVDAHPPICYMEYSYYVRACVPPVLLQCDSSVTPMNQYCPNDFIAEVQRSDSGAIAEEEIEEIKEIKEKLIILILLNFYLGNNE